MDDLSADPSMPLAAQVIDDAALEPGVALFHMHDPGTTVSRGAIEQLLMRAEDRGLDFVTYDELVAGPPRAAIALAFDDSAVDDWYGMRDLLAAHGARVTFFVTRWYELEQRQIDELHELAALGHGVEPHTVNHLHAPAYVAEHGLEGYLADEVLPSIEANRAAGFPPTSFAFPFGETTPEITAAVLEHIDRVRIGPGTCPHRAN